MSDQAKPVDDESRFLIEVTLKDGTKKTLDMRDIVCVMPNVAIDPCAVRGQG